MLGEYTQHSNAGRQRFIIGDQHAQRLKIRENTSKHAKHNPTLTFPPKLQNSDVFKATPPTFHGTGRKQCWHQPQAYAAYQTAQHHRTAEDHTYCSMAI